MRQNEIKHKDTEVKLVAEHLKQDAGPPKDIQALRHRLRENLFVLADGVMTCDNKSSLQELGEGLKLARSLEKDTYKLEAHHRHLST